MKHYVTPEIEIRRFMRESILTASTDAPAELTPAEKVREMMQKDGISAIAEVAFE